MSNTRAGSVIFVDTSAAFSDAMDIQSIKYIGNTSGAASIKKESSSGNALWEESGTANVYNANVDIRCPKGIYVTVSNSAKVYIYLKNC
jgi:hypothetical protein